jgi:hypothetical protein
VLRLVGDAGQQAGEWVWDKARLLLSRLIQDQKVVSAAQARRSVGVPREHLLQIRLR